MRMIATAAGVDTALIHHYFESKDGLFSSAIGEVFGGRSFLEGISGTSQEVARALVERYVDLWERPESQGALLAILRSAIDNDQARSLLVRFLNEEIFKVLAPTIQANDSHTRIGFIGSQMLGAVMIRYVFELESLSRLTRSEFEEVLVGAVERYIACDLPISG